MLSILRTKAVSLPGFSSTTRFLPTLPTYTRALSSSTFRAFTSSRISQQYGESRRGGFNDNHDSPPREDRSASRGPRNAASSTIFVANLPFHASREGVQDLFAEFGTVVAVRLAMSPSGESKGFAHVDLADVATAQTVMQANAESQFFLEGRALYLDYAGPPPSKTLFPPGETLHFGNFSGDEESLQAALGEFRSAVANLRIMRNPQTGASKNFGFIEFKTQEDATAVLEKFNGKEIAYGEALTLSYARGKRQDSAPPRFADQGGDGYAFGTRGRSGGFNNRSQPAYGGRGSSRSAGGESY